MQTLSFVSSSPPPATKRWRSSSSRRGRTISVLDNVKIVIVLLAPVRYHFLEKEICVRMTQEDVGVVVIGRNEGDRLVRCLASVKASARNFVYVDSGSTDESVDYAARIGAWVVQLDLTRPF